MRRENSRASCKNVEHIISSSVRQTPQFLRSSKEKKFQNEQSFLLSFFSLFLLFIRPSFYVLVRHQNVQRQYEQRKTRGPKLLFPCASSANVYVTNNVTNATIIMLTFVHAPANIVGKMHRNQSTFRRRPFDHFWYVVWLLCDVRFARRNWLWLNVSMNKLHCWATQDKCDKSLDALFLSLLHLETFQRDCSFGHWTNLQSRIFSLIDRSISSHHNLSSFDFRTLRWKSVFGGRMRFSWNRTENGVSLDRRMKYQITWIAHYESINYV